MAYFSRQELCHCQCCQRRLTIKVKWNGKDQRETRPLPRHQPRRCCSTLKLVRKSRTSNNKPSRLALYARRALPPMMLLTSLSTTINSFISARLWASGETRSENTSSGILQLRMNDIHVSLLYYLVSSLNRSLAFCRR